MSLILRLYSTFLLLTFILGCQKLKNKEPITEIKLEEKSNSKELEITNPKLIVLSDNNFSKIASIEKIIEHKDHLFILDKLIGNSVFIFNKEGKYINHIHRVGEGPGEYKNIDNLFLEKESNTIFLTPMDAKKKIYFDFNGTYLKEESFNGDISFSDFFLFENYEIVINKSHLNGKESLQIWKLNKLENSYFPFNDRLDDTPLNQRNLISAKNSEEVNFSIGLRDTIYSLNIKTKTIRPEYKIDLGNELSINEFSEIENQLKYFFENDINLGIIDLFQNQDFISFTSLNRNGLNGNLISKYSKKIYSTQEIINHYIGNLRFEGVLGLTSDSEFIAVLGKKEKSNWDFSKLQESSQGFSNLPQLDDEDFVILTFTLKEKR